MTKYHHVGTGPGNLNSRDYSAGGQLDIGDTGPFLTCTYVGVYCSHPNLNQPYTEIAGSKHYHQLNNNQPGIIAGGKDDYDDPANYSHYYGIFHNDDIPPTDARFNLVGSSHNLSSD